jgi:maleate cis-trans isomerase
MTTGRTRVGVLVPPANPTVEIELWRMAPAGVSFHVARLEAAGDPTPGGATTGMVERTRAYVASLDGAARSVGEVQPAVVVLAHTASSYVNGHRDEQRLVERLTAAASCPVLTAAGAIVDALHHLGVRRLALGTPYPDEISALGRAYWQAAGFEVVSHRRLDGVTNIYDETEARAAELARLADSSAAEAVLLSGTGLPTVGVLDALERELGKPVLSSNQAMLWRALDAVGRVEPLAGFGRLLAERGKSGARDTKRDHWHSGRTRR